MKTLLGASVLGLFLFTLALGSPFHGCQHHKDCSPEEYCEYGGTCRCREGHTREPDGRCVKRREAKVLTRDLELVDVKCESECANKSYVCRNGSCHSPDRLQDGVKETNQTSSEDEETNPTKEGPRSGLGILGLAILFCCQSITWAIIKAIYKKIKRMYQNCCTFLRQLSRSDDNTAPSANETSPTNGSLFSIAPATSEEIFDRGSLSSGFSLDSLRRTVLHEPDVEDRTWPSGNRSGPAEISQNHIATIDVPSAPPLAPPQSLPASLSRDDPPSYTSLQPLSCIHLDPPPYSFLQSPLSPNPNPPLYDEVFSSDRPPSILPDIFPPETHVVEELAMSSTHDNSRRESEV